MPVRPAPRPEVRALIMAPPLPAPAIGTVPGCGVGIDPAEAAGSAVLGDAGDAGAGGAGAPDDGVAGADDGGVSDFNTCGSAPVARAGVDAADGSSSAVRGPRRLMSGAMSAAC
jgi:hypothetical protein